MKKRILLVENLATDFINSRLSLGLYLKEQGYEVYAMVSTEQSDSYKIIEAKGIKVFLFPLAKNKINPISNLKSLKFFHKIIKNHDIDLVHSFKFQPNFFLALVKLFFNRFKLVHHITGLGTVFSNYSFKSKLLKYVSKAIFLFNFLIVDKVIVQNPDDINDLWTIPSLKKKVNLIKGSGVDIQKFKADTNNKIHPALKELNIDTEKTVLTLITRLVWDKGIREAVEAVDTLVHNEYSNLILLIVGSTDYSNPYCVTKEFVEKYANSSHIHFLGQQSDIQDILSKTNIYVYPSYYREGIPRSVLEALAMEKPIITTDMPGCNLTVISGFNGLLIRPRSSTAISEAIIDLKENYDLLTLGKNSRELARTVFNKDIIYRKIAQTYDKAFSEAYIIEDEKERILIKEFQSLNNSISKNQ